MRRALLTASVIVLATAGAHGETLPEALIEAYQSNPQILAERANLRATDEGVPQALSGWRPTVSVTGSAGPEEVTNQPPAPIFLNFKGTPQTVDLNVTQPLYNGGRTVAQTAQAEKTVRAERARNLATEATVFLSVAQAYLDVVRDQTAVDLNTDNEAVLRRMLKATEDQFRNGAVTRTDVAQAQARLAGAIASRAQAEGTLEASRAGYERAVGHVPQGRLAPPDLRPVLPASREEAQSLAALGNPNVVAAVYATDAARDAVDATRGQLLPSVSLVGDVNRAMESELIGHDVTTASVMLRVTVPLYEGGNLYSQTRQASEVVGQRLGQADDARRTAVQGTTQAWAQMTAARAQIASLETTIKAAAVALEGVRQEATVGARTVLDVLNAEQELFTDRVQLVTARHDLAVAEFTLSQQIGRLTADDLRLAVQAYDPDTHYRAVRDKWLGFGGKE